MFNNKDPSLLLPATIGPLDYFGQECTNNITYQNHEVDFCLNDHHHHAPPIMPILNIPALP